MPSIRTRPGVTRTLTKHKISGLSSHPPAQECFSGGPPQAPAPSASSGQAPGRAPLRRTQGRLFGNPIRGPNLRGMTATGTPRPSATLSEAKGLRPGAARTSLPRGPLGGQGLGFFDRGRSQNRPCRLPPAPWVVKNLRALVPPTCPRVFLWGFPPRRPPLRQAQDSHRGAPPFGGLRAGSLETSIKSAVFTKLTREGEPG